MIATRIHDRLVIEMIAGYGMTVGEPVFETCIWIGKFEREAEIRKAHTWKGFDQRVPLSDVYDFARVTRKEVKSHLCQATNVKDAQIRDAIIHRFGGDKETAIGNKKKPGPLYGIAGDEWSALAVAVTYAERR